MLYILNKELYVDTNFTEVPNGVHMFNVMMIIEKFKMDSLREEGKNNLVFKMNKKTFDYIKEQIRKNPKLYNYVFINDIKMKLYENEFIIFDDSVDFGMIELDSLSYEEWDKKLDEYIELDNKYRGIDTFSDVWYV